jgi:hypothetical protein
MNGEGKGWIPVVLGLGLIALLLVVGAFGADLTRAITVVVVAGATGGFVNVFFGDSGLHWPRVENQEFQPGFLSIVLVGGLAALVSWGATKAITIFGSDVQAVRFSTGDIANALLVGFGGAKWFKSEMEKDVLQKTAAIAAAKSADPYAAVTIATGTPNQALSAAVQMRT